MSPLSILNVAYPLAPVRPDGVGGAEQMLACLDDALVRSGHRSIVVACEGSMSSGELVSFPLPSGEFSDDARRAAQEECAQAINWVLRNRPVDLVHLHGLDFPEYLPPPGFPALATLHLPPGWYDRSAFQITRPETYLNCVSSSQRRACPEVPNLLPAIENGVLLSDDDAEFLFRPLEKRRFVLATGRICPEKGFHFALEAAKLARCPLLLAGRVFPYGAHEGYFREKIQPRLGPTRRFIGPVYGRGKSRLMRSARCLLVSSIAPETSSLVAMEALASGTPVVAFRVGALPEIIDHGRTGFLVNDVREMAEAIRQVNRLDPQVCREVARRRFSAERMAHQYIRRYTHLVARHSSRRELHDLAGRHR